MKIQTALKCLIPILVLSLAPAGLFADAQLLPPVPFNSYNYGVWDESVPAMPVYESDQVVNGFDLGVGALSNPSDLCTDQNGTIYILDDGNKRIIILDKNLRLIKVLTSFTFNGAVQEVTELSCLCVDSAGRLYIGDSGSKMVLVVDQNGVILKEILKPVSDLIDENADFLPQKILVDNSGVIYVLSFGSYQGAYTFNAQGDFLGFFGSNRVNVDAKLQSDRFWRQFMTKEQRSRMYRFVPVEYANFAIDRSGFIYTVSNFGDNEQRGQVKKLNPLSQNILFAGKKPELMFFGDWETTWTNRIEKSSLVAVDVDGDNFINVLDFERGRVFQYDQMCNLLAVFGGPGDQSGTFRKAIDLVTSDGRIVVLDEVKGSLTAFRLTRYGEALHRGTVLYEDGKYEDALGYWFEASRLDTNNHLVMRGLARAYERLERYRDAMKYYKDAQYHKAYSDAFREWRTDFLREHFAAFALIITLLLASPFVLPYLRSLFGKKKKERVQYISVARFPFHLILHPFKGWEELKYEKKGSLLIANVILFFWFLMNIIEFQFTGFVFNFNRLDQMNLLITFASTIGFFTLWSVTNWGVCTLQDGKGTFREIWIFSAYALLTSVLATIPLVLFSNVLTAEEGMFLSLVTTVVQGWTAVQMLLAIRAVHQYTLKKTLGSLFLTVVGILLVVIVIVLFVSLFSQFYGFAATIFQEILLRL